MKFARYCALLCSLAIPPVLAAPGDIQVGVRQEGMRLSVEGWLETRVSRELAWSVLTDYERFPDFVPGIRANRIVRAEGAEKTIEQKGEISTALFRMAYEGAMRVEETPGKAMTIVFLSGPFKDVRGEWRLEPGEDKKPRTLRLVYQMDMDMLKTPFPPPLAPAIAEQQVRAWVRDFAREMETRVERRKAKDK